VLPEVRADLGLSPTVAGLLTTLPVLCFAVLAPAAAWLGRRTGTDVAVLAGLAAIAVGTVVRVLDGGPVLLAGTFVIGAAMTIGNVLLPTVVKREFPARAGPVTGLFTVALTTGAALTAGLTAPLAQWWGWRAALASWAVLAVAACGVWWAATGRRRAASGMPGPAPARAPSAVPLWRDPVAWAVSVQLALQAFLYNAMTAWLPSLLVEHQGVDLGGASVAATVFQLLGIAGALAVPALVGRWRDQRLLAGAVAGGWAVFTGGLLLWPGAWLLWTVVGGVVQGAGISLAMTLVVLRGHDHDVVRRLSGMQQLVGYGVAAAGPLAVGALYAATGGWTAPLAMLVGCSVAMLPVGLASGRRGRVGAGRSSV
jgi:CP family cyanate transporter-like MFS transporter